MEKPGLASDIIRSVNEQLALLAADKGCVYLDLWETLADGEGNLKEVLAAPDGVHFSAGNGYGAWVTYLRNHAKYAADVLLQKDPALCIRDAGGGIAAFIGEELTSACSLPSCAARG